MVENTGGEDKKKRTSLQPAFSLIREMFTRETQEWTLQQLFKKLEVPYGITGHKKNSENLLTKGRKQTSCSK